MISPWLFLLLFRNDEPFQGNILRFATFSSFVFPTYPNAANSHSASVGSRYFGSNIPSPIFTFLNFSPVDGSRFLNNLPSIPSYCPDRYASVLNVLSSICSLSSFKIPSFIKILSLTLSVLQLQKSFACAHETPTTG